jgi:hypothetical protein
MEIINRALNFSLISRIRRNHALEHATLQILSKKHSKLSVAGYSDTRGFLIVGNVSTDQLRDGVNEALRRLQAGEEDLAIHPNCGTNFAATGLVTGTLAWLAMVGAQGRFQKRLERWPVVVILVTLSMIMAQPLGPLLQAKFTTDADIGELQVTEITRFEREGTPLHRVKTVN